MGGYVASSRKHDQTFAVQKTTNAGSSFTDSATMPLSDTVYSWRTGRLEREHAFSSEELLRSNHDEYGSSYLKFGGSRNVDNGHLFEATQYRFATDYPSFNISVGSRPRFSGPLITWFSGENPFTRAFPTPGILNDWYGSTAISDVRPTNSILGFAQTLGELREGVPQFVFDPSKFKTLRGTADNIAGTHLAVEFAFKPFIDDLVKILKQVGKSADIISDFQAGSGKPTHRRRQFDPVRSTIQTQQANVTYPLWSLNSPNYSGLFINGSQQATVTRTLTTTEEYSFSGSFTYYVPSYWMDRVKNYESVANHILGLRLTPELVWELAPWSWLSDWLWSLGNVITNASAFQQDGLVMTHGYLMRKTTQVESTLAKAIPFVTGYRDVNNTRTTTRKERVRASPYGFGQNPTVWNTRKWTVLADLLLLLISGKLSYQ